SPLLQRLRQRVIKLFEFPFSNVPGDGVPVTLRTIDVGLQFAPFRSRSPDCLWIHRSLHGSTIAWASRAFAEELGHVDSASGSLKQAMNNRHTLELLDDSMLAERSDGVELAGIDELFLRRSDS